METIIIQGETISFTGTETVYRTQTGTREDDSNGGTTNSGPGQTFDEFGLRRNYTGDGYLDINGSGTGARASFQFTGEPGENVYAITLRIANGSNNNRPIALEIDGTVVEIVADTNPRQWDNWETRTVEFTLTGEGPHTVSIRQETSAGAPNIDAVAIHEPVVDVSFAAPEFTSPATFSIAENETAIGTVSADDLDDDPVTISITGGADQDLVSIDANGALSFDAAPDFENPTDADTDNSYVVEVTADDGADTTTQTVTVNVTDDTTEGLATPTIDTIILQAENGDIAQAGESFARTQAAALADVENGTPYSVAEGPANSDNSSGTKPLDAFGLREGYSGTGYLDFEQGTDEAIAWTVNVDAGGQYDLHVRYANGGQDRPLDIVVGTDIQHAAQSFAGDGFEVWLTKTFTVVLEEGDNNITLAIAGNTNGPNVDAVALTSVGATPVFPPANVAPAFAAVPATAIDVAENTTAVDSFAATDADGDTVTYDLSGDDADLFTIDAAGDLAFITPPDAEAPGDVGTDGTYEITVEATDGELTTTADLAVTVTDDPNDEITPNQAPTTLNGTATTDEDTSVTIPLADLVADDADADADLAIGASATNGAVTVDGTDLIFTPEADFNGEATITYTATDLDEAASDPATIAVTVNAVDDPATITLTPVAVQDDEAGAVVATITIADVDGDTYGPGDFQVDDARFEVVDDGGLKLQLLAGETLDADAPPQPTVSLVADSSVSATATLDVVDTGGPVAVLFDADTITPYNANQDQPEDGGAVTVSDDGTAITLDGNFWKRAPLDAAYTITADTRIQVDIAVGADTPEIVSIGFDDNDNPFQTSDGSNYQLAGTQGIGTFVDLRGQGVDQGGGVTRFLVDLSAHAGETISSLTLVSDDDNFGNGRGAVTFSNVALLEDDTIVTPVNGAPVEVGDGVTDFAVDEGDPVEVDLPFVDPDGDAMVFEFAVTDAGGLPVAVPGLTLDGAVLSGTAPEEPGVYTVTLTATDPAGSNTTATSTFTLTVNPVNDAPISENPALEPYFVQAGNAIDGIDLAQFETYFSDPDNDPLTLSATGLPPGLSVNSEGVITGTPTAGGTYNVEIVASDPSDETASFQIVIDVDAPDLGDAIVVEAENFTGLAAAENFFGTGQAGASGDRIIRASNSSQPSEVTTDLTQNGLLEGWYQVAMTRYDETDGSATFSLTIGDTVLASDAAFDGVADGETANDSFDNDASRGNAGQAGNLKTVTFDTPVYVTAGTILTLSGQATGELLRTDKFSFTRIDAPNAPPSLPTLDTTAVAENVDGAVVGTLASTDPEGTDVSFTVDDPRFEVDAAGQLKLAAGQTLDAETEPSIDLLVTAIDEDGVSSSQSFTITVTDGDDAPAPATLDNSTVAENADGAVIGTLASVDPEGEAVSFTVDDPRFIVDGDDQLTLVTGASLNHEVEPTVDLLVTATDQSANATTTTLTITVTDENDAPTLAAPDALGDVDVALGTATTVDLTALGATDEDGTIPTYGVRLASGDPLPAEIAVAGTDLGIGSNLPAGTYELEIFATDGELDSESVPLTVTVGAPAPFETIILQGEDFNDLSPVDDTNPNVIRTVGNNVERDPQGQDLPGVGDNPGLPDFDPVTGLRPNYTGTGYFDPQGTDTGAQAQITFDAPAGTYDVTVRLANGAGARPMTFDIDGVSSTVGDTATGEFYLWETRTFQVTLPTGGTHTLTIEQDGSGGAANIDAIAIHEPGTTVDFFAGTATDDSADEDGNLAATPVLATVDADAADAVAIDLVGIDDDIETIEVSVDGGDFVPATVTGTGADRTVTIDLQAFGPGTSVPITLRVTDLAGNEATTDTAVAIADATTGDFTFNLQLETRDGSVTIDDTVGTTGTSLTQIRDPQNPEDANDQRGSDGLWDGFEGAGYMDMGADPGDAIEFSVTAPETGDYTFSFRYAHSTAAGRPMTITVDGGQETTLQFPGTGAFDTWQEQTVELSLDAGANTIRLANVGNNGPNLDSVTVTGEVDDTGGTGEVEPGPRETIKINFQDGSTPAAVGYLVANFEGFADQGNGFSYGFVTEASATDADGTTATPIDGTRYPTVAINERSGSDTLPDDGSLPSDMTGAIDVSGYDPRLLGYAHTDLPGYPGDQDDPNERVAFELALENGWYEVTVAVGDTAGPNDSDNSLRIEGNLVADWTPVSAYKTELVTTVVEVEDGFLTLDGRDGSVTEFQYLEVRELPDLTPDDVRPAPADYAAFVNPTAVAGVGAAQTEADLDPATGPVTGIDPTSDITIGIDVAPNRGGALLESLQDGSIQLYETLTGEPVPFGSNTTGGFDSLTISPTGTLKEFTSYTLVIDGFQDRGSNADATAPTREFQKFSTTFTTGEAPEVESREVAFTENIETTEFSMTSLEMSPDGAHLYGANLAGEIKRWDVDPVDGSLSNEQTLALDYFDEPQEGRRGIIGLTFDPNDPQTLWVTDNFPIPLSGRDNDVPDFSGRVSKITLGTGADLTGTAEAYITGLPRSNGDHVTNSLEFRPNFDGSHQLYLIQGSNTAMGEADSAWGFRPERLLNAAVMEIDHTRNAPAGGFDVQTEPLPASGNRRFEYSTVSNGNLISTDDGDLKNGPLDMGNGQFLVFAENGTATVQDGSGNVVESFYDPFASDAVLKIFATGQRNAYDLVWHSNGLLYTPTNGSASGGNAPDNPDTVQDESAFGIERQDDYLFVVSEGSYSGHPNPVRNEFILNGGNPTAGADPNQVNKYPVGIEPESNYVPERAYSLGPNRSPNGAIEYKSDAFGTSLQNALLFTEYSSGNDLRAIILDDAGLPMDDFVLRDPQGNVISHPDPLDVIEGADGRLYLLTLNRSNGESLLIRLDPAPGDPVDGGGGGGTADSDADVGDDLTLTLVDASNAAAVQFQISGLDDDIQTLVIELNGGDPITVPAANGQVTIDASGITGEIIANLIATDDNGNIANALASFTGGDAGGGTGGGTLIDATAFTVLSTLTGTSETLVRRIDDPTTYETSSSTDANNDGLNDGYDGLGYLDPNGGAEDKASFTFDAAAAGTYELTFRMANGNSNPRPIAIKTGDQSVTIADTTTGSFGTWQDFTVTLTLEAGDNTIVIEQTTDAGGPNVDSVTVTPLDVTDGTADVGDDLALTVVDATDPANVEFAVTGLDADITSIEVSFDGGTTTQDVTLVDGGFTANLTGQSGDVTAELTVSDGTNEKTVSTTFQPGTGVPNDGVETVGGVEFTIYEAENAALDGPVVVMEDRTQSGDFVDFDGTADQTVTWTVAVPEAGDYAVDILYALATTKDARPMTLTVDGVDQGALPFAPNSNEGETLWAPQSTSLNFATAGTHTIAVTAPGANGPNLDYLRISSQPLTGPLDNSADEGDALTLTVLDQTDASAVEIEVAGLDDDITSAEISFNGGTPIPLDPIEDGVFIFDTGIALGQIDALLTVQDGAGNEADAGVQFAVAPDGDPDADIAVQSLDPAFFDDRLHFSFVSNSDGRSSKETAQFEITNTGTETLDILGVEISEFYSIAGPELTGTSIAAGDSITVTVAFDGSTGGPNGFPSRASNVSGVYEGTLTLVTNDAEDPFTSLDLAAFWQPAQEGGNEPNVNEVWQVFGFGNEIAGLPFAGGGENSILDFDDLYLPAPGQEGVEILSPYWRIADGVTEARATMIAAYNASQSAGLGLHAPGNKGQDIGLTAWGPNSQSQRLFPLENGGNFATELFDNGDIPNGWEGNDVFGIEMAGLSTDPTLNDSGNGTPSQSALNANYGQGTYSVSGTGANAVVTDAQGNVVEDGYTVRMFQALDADGTPIQNVYLGMMDYTGINYDYNDNMFVFEGIAPVGSGGVLNVSGLDDAAADDRLVFTNIENPNNAGGLTQNFRNVATFTIANDGIGTLDIAALAVTGSDAAAFEIVSGPTVGTTLAPGASVDVTVEFVGEDGVNDNAAVLYDDAAIAITPATGPAQTVALAGLSQLQSEAGEEPTVAQIVQALGYGTDVAQGQLANGGIVEAVGDEVLVPYLQAANDGQPVEVIDVAAFLTQGRISRLSKHDVGDAGLIELYAADDQQGQTVLPDGLVPGAGDTGSVARASFDGATPFGLKITVDGFPTFSAWTDPDANLQDPAFDLGPNNEGHYLRFFQAKDAAGNDIPGTLIAIQDYPGGENFDYNDHMFVIKNVTAYDPAGAEDADSNGVVDTLETDADNDDLVDFFDDDFSQPQVQAPFGGTAPVLGDTLTLLADTFDTGGQGVAWNDDPGKNGGSDARPDSDVEIIDGDVAFVETGEWLEYTIDVAEAGDYDISFLAKAPTDGATIAVSIENGPALATITLPDANAPGDDGFGGTDFGPTDSATIPLQAGQQTLRLTFGGTVADNGYVLDLRAIALDKVEPVGNAAPTTTGIAGAPAAAEGEAYSFNVSTFFDDGDPGDTLTFTATGLPAGLAISAAGLITGTPDEVTADTLSSVTVTASDGTDSVNSSFDLTVADVPDGGPDQAPFPGPGAATFAGDSLTVAAQNYDEGGQGVAYNDAAGLAGGSSGGRANGDVEQTGAGDIGWIAGGEWYEYTIDVPAAGTYDLDLLLSFGSSGTRSATVDFFAPNSDTPYETSGPIANPSTTGWTDFQNRDGGSVELQAGTQVVRVTFQGGSQDFRSFTLTQQETTVPNQAPVIDPLAALTLDEGQAVSVDLSALISDPDADDTFTVTAAGLPSGISISEAGLITGTAPLVDATTSFDVTVTATDAGGLTDSETFSLTINDIPDAPQQTPFPGAAPVLGDLLTVDATNFDEGGQGVAWNDDPGKDGGNAVRTGTDVEFVGSQNDIGYVEAGEWLEYTIDVAEAGDYALSVNAKTPIGGNSIDVSLEGGPTLASFALADSNGASNGFGGTTFGATAAQTIALDAGLQTLRLTFDGTPASNGYLMDVRNFTLEAVEPATPDAIGQAGTVTFAQSSASEWFTVEFDEALDNPSVVMGPLSFNGAQPATVRVRNVDSDGFEFQLDEWDYLDGGHTTETVSWLAIEEGVHNVGGLTMAAGSGTASDAPSTIGFGTDAFGGTAPVVMAQVTSTANGGAVTDRVDDVTATGFNVALDNEEVKTAAHGPEALDWIAVSAGGSAGAGAVAGSTGNVVTHNATSVGFGGAFGGAFAFLADMQTEDGGDPSVVRTSALSATGASVFIEEETSNDAETNHTTEDVGWFGIDTGLIFDDTPFV